MTRKVMVTNVNEIKYVKVSCQKCGFLVQFPIDKGYQKVKQCIYCETPVPANEVQRLMSAIEWLQKATGKNGDFSGVAIEFETHEVE